MNIALKANIFHSGAAERVSQCLDHLLGKGARVWVDQALAPMLEGRGLPVIENDLLPKEIDLVIALGGDGTMLAAARMVGEKNLPIYGVNMGNFGFLATGSLEEFSKDFDCIARGDYHIEERMVVRAVVVTGAEEKCRYMALNDVVLHKGALARPILISLRAGDELVGVFPADGVIISTPTGSTAYSLSAGGPILHPLMNAITITPICPHTLAVRPLVVPADIPIRVSEQSSHRDVVLTVDGQESRNISEEDDLVVTRASHVIRLLKPFNESFFKRLRSKLKWGERERT